MPNDTEPIDYGIFDRLSSQIFYPRPYWSPPPAGALDFAIPVAAGVTLSARFYPAHAEAANLVFFHGNGEIACEYDSIAPEYNKVGAGLWVMDFRGYGRSTGRPLVSNLIEDARTCFEFARAELRERGFGGPLFVKGRSLGTHSALEVAARYADDLAGLITESGASVLGRLAQMAGLDPRDPAVERVVHLHDEKLRSIELPLLAIHGEHDELVPLSAAREMLATIGSTRKHLEVIPGAGHNDLLWLGRQPYFEALRRFVAEQGASS